MCGRIRGYQFGAADAFHCNTERNRLINTYYVDGISLTHGGAGNQQHIWTLAAGRTEVGSRNQMYKCPCDSSPNNSVPAFVTSVKVA